MAKRRTNKPRRQRKSHYWFLLRFMLFVVIVVAIAYGVRRCGTGGTESDGAMREDSLPHLNDLVKNSLSDNDATAEMDSTVAKFIRRWELKGLQIAVSRNDSLVYAKGYGWADKETGEAMTPAHVMRVASVSKLITAAGIMRLQEMGKVRLTDRVFGEQGILNDTAYTNVITDKRYFDITVEDLLRHRAGFTNGAGDPLFSTRYIMMQNRLASPPDHRTLLRIALRRRLGYEPGGEARRYCNIGYMLLSMIIEKLSGEPYEEFMQHEVLRPAGCFGFTIAGNYEADRHPGEVKYYMHKEAQPIEEFNNSGRMVVKCYGENNIPELAGAGAWCASATELCHFVSAIDGDTHYPDVLSKESVEAMTEEMPGHAFSLGWNFTTERSWTRTGTLSGTSAFVAYYPQEHQCWVVLSNTSIWKGQGFAQEASQLIEKLRDKYSPAMKPLGLDFPKRK